MTSPKQSLTAKPKKKTDFTRKRFTVHARHHTINLGIQTKIMGIVNATPDSFSNDGCLKQDTHFAIDYALKQIKNGADIIDIGGESTRPGSERISEQEELNRVIPVIEEIAKQTNTPISIDTYKPKVAEAALKAGACIVNNILGTQLCDEMVNVVKSHDAAIVLMHMRGTPKTMQDHIEYENIIAEIRSELQKSIEYCLENGVKSDRIIIDPGIGFGKTVEHNLSILRRLGEFQDLHQPILLGSSRKSFIGKTLNREVDERLTGTMATVTAGILNGAHIVRVHDVSDMADTVAMSDAIVNEQLNII